MSGIASDGDRPDADPVLDEAAVSITDEMLASLKGDADDLGDAVVEMETSADRGTAEASFERQFMKTIEGLAKIAVDYARRTAGPAPASSPTMLGNAAALSVHRTHKARQLIFDKLAGGDATGILADARRAFGI